MITSCLSSVHTGSGRIHSSCIERGCHHSIGQFEVDPRTEPVRGEVRSASDVQLQPYPDINHAELRQRAETAATEQPDR